ncbi:unnamed protein product, partial [Boreogadus saida]
DIHYQSLISSPSNPLALLPASCLLVPRPPPLWGPIGLPSSFVPRHPRKATRSIPATARLRRPLPLPIRSGCWWGPVAAIVPFRAPRHIRPSRKPAHARSPVPTRPRFHARVDYVGDHLTPAEEKIIHRQHIGGPLEAWAKAPSRPLQVLPLPPSSRSPTIGSC